MKCNQCGHSIDDDKPRKKCPKCGESLQDEMKQKVRKSIRLSGASKTAIVVSVIITLVLCCLMLYFERTYTWDEKINTTVVGKNDYTTTTYIKSGDVYIPVTHYHYDLHLANGEMKDDGSDAFYRYNVGDNYTYYVTHRDWKPEMKDAPIPIWLYLVPLAVGVIIFGVVFAPIYLARAEEMQEFEEKGDLKIERGNNDG